MTDLDPEVLQLFAERRRPIDAGRFVVQVTAGLEREEGRRCWRRRAGLGAALLVSALSLPWLMRQAALVADELAADVQIMARDARLDPPGLSLVLLCLMAFGAASLWRLLRRAA
jgi:hypothetical protein